MFPGFAKQKFTGIAKQKKIALLLLVMVVHSQAETCESDTSSSCAADVSELLQTNNAQQLLQQIRQESKLPTKASANLVNSHVSFSGGRASTMEGGRTNSTSIQPSPDSEWDQWTKCKGPMNYFDRGWDTSSQVGQKYFYQEMVKECKAQKKKWLCATRAHCDYQNRWSTCLSTCIYGGKPNAGNNGKNMDSKRCYTNLLHPTDCKAASCKCNTDCGYVSQHRAKAWRYKCVDDNNSNRVNKLLKDGFPVRCDKLDGNGLTSDCLRNFVGSRRRRYKCMHDSTDSGAGDGWYKCGHQNSDMR